MLRAIFEFRFSSFQKGGSNSVVESQPSKLLVAGSIPVSRSRFFDRATVPAEEGGATSCADVAQLVEHVLGKDGVSGSIPLIGSRVDSVAGV